MSLQTSSLIENVLHGALSYHCEVLYHSTVYSSFMELVFILRQTNIIQPP